MSATATRPNGHHGALSAGVALLLDLDPDLGQLLEEPRRTRARIELRVRMMRLPRGEWSGGTLISAYSSHLGLLVLDGAISRRSS